MAGSPTFVLEVIASIADCIDPALPDPDACAASQPANTMGVDGDFSQGAKRHSYLRFELAPELGAATVLEATLALTVSSFSSAQSVESGTVWQVEPFTRDDLFIAAPALVGAAPLVGAQGAVAQNQTVPFPLPVPLVLSDGALCLGVLPQTTDGIDYWNLHGAVPPRLVLTVR
jgi:hypothetical protein